MEKKYKRISKDKIGTLNQIKQIKKSQNITAHSTDIKIEAIIYNFMQINF